MALEEKKHRDVLTNYEIVSLYISSVQTFVDVASKLELERGFAYEHGKRLFNEAIGIIKETKKKLSDVS